MSLICVKRYNNLVDVHIIYVDMRHTIMLTRDLNFMAYQHINVACQNNYVA